MFLRCAEKIEALGGIEQYKFIDISPVGSRHDGAHEYRLTFRIRFAGKAQMFYADASIDGVEHFMTNGSFVTDPMTQFCIWAEYLWQDYQGCYFDPDLGEYVYTTPAE